MAHWPECLLLELMSKSSQKKCALKINPCQSEVIVMETSFSKRPELPFLIVNVCFSVKYLSLRIKDFNINVVQWKTLEKRPQRVSNLGRGNMSPREENWFATMHDF